MKVMAVLLLMLPLFLGCWFDGDDDNGGRDSDNKNEEMEDAEDEEVEEVNDDNEEEDAESVGDMEADPIG